MMLRLSRSIFALQRYYSTSSRMERGYDEAIKALNSLQTNYQFLDAVLKEKQKNVHLNLPQTVADLERSGMTVDDLVMFIHNCVF